MVGQLNTIIGEGEFIKIIKTIYTEQKAKIVVNRELTESINIYRGTRQGCLLSQLLFILTQEASGKTKK